MIRTYKHISDPVFLVGVNPIWLAAIAIVAVLLFLVWWPLAIIFFVIGYWQARKHRDDKIQLFDFIIYNFYLPDIFSVEKEYK